MYINQSFTGYRYFTRIAYSGLQIREYNTATKSIETAWYYPKLLILRETDISTTDSIGEIRTKLCKFIKLMLTEDKLPVCCVKIVLASLLRMVVKWRLNEYESSIEND